MKVETVRKRMEGFVDRWERDLAALDRMFPHTDLENQFGNACEAIRNLATAISYAKTFGALSDEGVQHELDEYRHPRIP